MLQQPELLAPAGSLETLKYAVMYGADAVYCALPEFGMRAAPVNLTVGELREGCIFAHARGKKVYLTLNTFVHGAMCMSVSGRCLLSSYMAGRSGNRGECAQPCRWKYNLVEEHRPGQYMEIGETPDNGSYILNANDLCTAPFIDLICKAGVDSLKIEGRAKTFYYVASVVSAYRRALDTFLADPYNDNFELPDAVIEELNRTSHRHYSPGFYFGKEQAQQTPSHTYVRDWDFIGTVDSWENGVAHCTQRGKFEVGDSIEILQPDGSVVKLTSAWIENADGERVDATPHPMMQYTIPCETPLMAYSLIRMQKQ